VNIAYPSLEDNMGRLAVRLTDSHTHLRLDDRATITLNGTTFDQFESSDSTYMTANPVASGNYTLEIEHPDYNSATLTVDRSDGGVSVRGESGAVVVVTVSATKDIIEVQMETIYTLTDIRFTDATRFRDTDTYIAIKSETGIVLMEALLEHPVSGSVSYDSQTVSPSVFLWDGGEEYSQSPPQPWLRQTPLQTTEEMLETRIRLTVGTTTLDRIIRLVGYAVGGRVVNEGGELAGADVDLMHPDYLHDPDADSLQNETTDENGDFYIEGSAPAGLTKGVLRVRSDGHFPAEIPIEISSGSYIILIIRLHSAANTLIIIGLGHGINTDNRDNTGNWTVALNPFHMRTLMEVATGNAAPHGSSHEIGHDPAHYFEDEGTGWFGGELNRLITGVSPNIYSTRNLSRTAAQMRTDVSTQNILMAGGQPDPNDWRRSVLWHLKQIHSGGTNPPFEFRTSPNSHIYRHHLDTDYSFGPVYRMGLTGTGAGSVGYTHTMAVADYGTYLTRSNATLLPVMVEFHSNAGNAERTVLFYRTTRGHKANVTAAPVFTGTGDARIAELETGPATVAEDWQVTYALATNDWEVEGTVSGIQANRANNGVHYASDSSEIEFDIHSIASVSPVTPAPVNTGNGFLDGLMATNDLTLTEAWTVTCLGANTWEVGGTLSGTQGNTATTNVLYLSATGGIAFTILDGTIPFAAGDSFTFNTSSVHDGDRFQFSTVIAQSGIAKPDDDRFAKTVALNTKETFEAQPAAGLPAGTPVVRGRNTHVRNTGGPSNVFEAVCPTIVFETAFHDNLNDLTRIMSEYFQRNIALGAFRGIRDYYFPRLKGELQDITRTVQPNKVVYVTTTNVNPASIADIYHSSVTDGNGIFNINLDRNTDFWLWVEVNGTFQALNPQQVNLSENDPPVNLSGHVVSVPNPKVFAM
jgi:hypothetical protein